MTVRIGDNIKLVRPPGNLEHGRYEVNTNDDKPLVLTLRNAARMLVARSKLKPEDDEKGFKLPKSKLGLMEALKIGVIAIGGIVALVMSNDAKASVGEEPPKPEETPEPNVPKIEVPASANTELESQEPVNEPEPINEEVVAKKSNPVRGPASDTSLAPKTKKSDSMLSDRIGNASTESVDSAIDRAAKATGEDPKQLRAMIHLESKGDPRAKSGQYLGLGQIGKEAWNDVKSSTGIKLPELTNDADDPRFDPYTNALVTAKLMGLNRKRVAKAAKAAGYQTVTLGLLYSAHNVGATTTNKILAEKDSDKWDATTKKFVGNQAKELISGGIGNYLGNAERSMSQHYAAVNTDVGSQQVAQAESIGVMSSVAPAQLPQRQRVAPQSAVQVASTAPTNVPIKVATYVAPKKRQQVAEAQQGAPQPQAQRQRTAQADTSETPEPFRLRNGKLAAV